MACSCGSSSPIVGNADLSSDRPASPRAVDSDDVETFSFLTLVDGLTGFYGRITNKPSKGSLVVDVVVGGLEAVYRLDSATSDSVPTGLQQGDTVIGAFRPTRAGLISDPSSTDYGKFVISGVCSVIEKWRIPGIQSDVHGRHDIDRHQAKSPDDFPPMLLKQLGYDQGISQEGIVAVNALLNDSLRHVLDVIRRSRSPAELFALVRTLVDTGFLAHHFHLCTQGYRLLTTDVVPGFPGKESGAIHSVFRYFNNDDLHHKTLLTTSKYLTRSDFSLSNCEQAPSVSVQPVDPDAWNSSYCAQCRNRCSQFAKASIQGSPKHGIRAVQSLATMFDAALKCYASCSCN